MADGACKDCRHWHALTDDYGTCMIVPTMAEASEDATVFVDGYGTALYTGPDFGCNRFEKED